VAGVGEGGEIMFIEVEKLPDGTWVDVRQLPSYVPYGQWGIIRIQPNGDRRRDRDLWPLWGIHEQNGDNPETFRMLGYSLMACLWKLLLHKLGKKWPDEVKK
jgi:hypothetical protein